MNKIFYVLLLLTLILSSCWSSEDENKKEVSDKTGITSKKSSDFIFETKNLKDFESSYTLEKSGKILSDQIIDVKSQTSGDILKVYVKEGDSIYAWQTLALLKDNFNSKSLSLEKTKISLEKAKINYDSRIISLDKSIADTKLNLDKIKSDLEIEKAKLEQDLNKARLDYSDNISGDNDKINDYIDDTKKEYLDLKIYLYDIIDFADKILWITDRNKDKNDSFENYFWAKDTALKSQTENKLKELINFNENLKNIDTNITKDNIVSFLINFEDWYNRITLFLDNLEETLNSSVVSTNFSQSTIDSYISSINSKQSLNLSNYSWYLSLKSNINTFLNTYKQSDNNFDNDSYLLDWTTSDEIAYNKTILSIKDSINTLENQLQSAKLSYDNALKNKEVSLLSAQNDIDSAQNAYNSSLAEYSKLTVKSPINWVVSELKIDKATYVWNNSNLLSIVWNKNTEIELSMSKAELFWIKISDEVNVIYNQEKFAAKVYSIWKVADSNLNFKVKIIITDDITLTGWVASVIFDIKLEDITLLPIDVVNVIWWNIWTINLYIDWKLKELKVSLWKVYNNMIEIKGKYNFDNEVVLFEWNPEVIITDMKKYNPERNKLVKEGTSPQPSPSGEGVDANKPNKEENESAASFSPKGEKNSALVIMPVVQEWGQEDKPELKSMTREERKAYMESLSEEERDKLRSERK